MDSKTQLSTLALNNRLRIKHLDVFRSVYTKRSVRQAAIASAITQPAASKLIQELEEMLGEQLFIRSRQGMDPTPYAEIVWHHSKVLLADLGNMQKEISLLSKGITGFIRLGVIPSYSSTLLADCIEKMITTWPGVRFSIYEGSTSELLKMLAANELDFAFARLMNASDMKTLEIVDIYAESFAFVCAPDNPLASKEEFSWHDLGQAKWILPAQGTPLRELVNGLFRQNAVPVPEPSIEISSFEKSQHIISRTEMVELLPLSLAYSAAARELVTIIGPILPSFGPISLVRRKSTETSPIAEAFINIVRKITKVEA